MFDAFYEKGYIFADGILARYVSTRKLGDITLYKTKPLVGSTASYVAKQDSYYAHGDTVEKALRDLRFKQLQADFDCEELVATIKQRGTVTFNDYRLLTGACESGLEDGLRTLGKAGIEEMSLEEAITLSTGHYGSELFKQLLLVNN